VRGALSILGGIVFFILAVMLFAIPISSNIFVHLLAALADYFLIAHLFYAGLAYVIIRLYLIILHEGSHVDDDNEFSISEENIDDLSNSIFIGFVIFLAISTIPAYKFSWDLALGCDDWSAPCRYFNLGYGFGSNFMYALSHLAALVYSFVMFFAIVGFGVLLGGSLPTFVAGVIALSHENQFDAAVKRTLAVDRPDREIERELAKVMRDNLVNEQQVEELVSQLSPINQWVKRIQYRKRLRDARRLREMAAAKLGALREEGQLAERIHDVEGARRERDDRRPMR